MKGMPDQTVRMDYYPSPASTVVKSAPLLESSIGSTELPLRRGYSDVERNAWIEQHLIFVDRAYAQFVAGLQASRTGWGLGAGILDLAFGVASSLTPSAGVKANYAAASTLLTGSYAVITKEAFIEKTVSALVSAMDARRKAAVVQIRRGMLLDERAYTASAAHADLLEYQRASSLVGGLSFIETAAQKDIEKSVADIGELTPEGRVLRVCVKDLLFGLKEQDHAKFLAAIRVIDPKFKDEASTADLAQAFNETRLALDAAYDTRVLDALRAAGLTQSKCGG